MERRAGTEALVFGFGGKPTQPKDIKFDIKSGMGKGIYAINTNKDELSFQIEVIRSGS